MANLKQTSSSKWELLIAAIEEKVVKGEHGECRRALRRLVGKKDIPTAARVKLGEIAFRVNAPELALRVLQSRIYPKTAFSTPASDRERVIYSTGLSSLGAYKEALAVLANVDVTSDPEALFHGASAHMFSWNYEAALPLLERYVSMPKVAPYRRLVGNVNLVATYISLSMWAKAADILSAAEAECRQNGYSLLLGNCLELKGQIELFGGRYQQALFYLTEARELLQSQQGNYLLFVDKWMIFCRCQLLTDDLERRQEADKFDEIRVRARQTRHWGTLREADLLEAVVKGDGELLRKVMMGTPSESYRRRARRLSGIELSPLGDFFLHLAAHGSNQVEPTTFDPYLGKNGEALYRKPLLLKLFEGLTRDFYQPATIGMLFQTVYIDEKFNPYTSPARVLQLLRRLDSWFRAQGVPLRVEFRKSEFALKAECPVLIRITRGKKLSSLGGAMNELKATIGLRTFSAARAAVVLGISKSSVERLLREAIEGGLVERHGRGRGVVYALRNARSRKAA